MLIQSKSLKTGGALFGNRRALMRPNMTFSTPHVQPDSVPLPAKPPQLISQPPRANLLRLQIEVSDPEVISAVEQYPEGSQRNHFLQTALRLGVLSLRAAAGDADAGRVKQLGEKVMADIRELLAVRSTELTSGIANSLAQYLDPSTGLLPQKLQQLVKKGGDLEELLQQHLGTNDSLLARTLAAHLGEQSILARMLSPTDARGIRAQVESTITAALAEQRRLVLQEFSLDHKQSALSRLVQEIQEIEVKLQSDVTNETKRMHDEFSLDRPNSALSRLVTKIEAAQKVIADQFSKDNEQSAMNRISKLVEATNVLIDKNLTLDDEQSSLARIKRELQNTVETLLLKNTEFQTDIKETLSRIEVRREEAARSTRHGASFEEQLGNLLLVESQRLGDICQPAGNSTGAIRNCKKGDHVIALGPESPAPGQLIVWEAKEEQRYSLKDALNELEIARKNRQAQVGVFVFSQKSAPAGVASFGRYGTDLVVVWDAEDPTSDVFVKAAYSVGRALVIRFNRVAAKAGEAADEIDRAVRAVEKHVKQLEEIETWAGTAKSSGEKILERARKMREDLVGEVQRLDANLIAIRAEATA